MQLHLLLHRHELYTGKWCKSATRLMYDSVIKHTTTIHRTGGQTELGLPRAYNSAGRCLSEITPDLWLTARARRGRGPSCFFRGSSSWRSSCYGRCAGCGYLLKWSLEALVWLGVIACDWPSYAKANTIELPPLRFHPNGSAAWNIFSFHAKPWKNSSSILTSTHSFLQQSASAL